MTRRLSSLRVRLMLALVALGAAGLLALAAVTYFEQRSFLLSRVDTQVRGAGPIVARVLTQRGIGGGPVLPVNGRGRDPRSRDRRGGPLNGGGRAPDHGTGPDDVNLPPGTYGERRSAAGRNLGHVTIGYGQSNPASPTIGASPPVGRIFTASSSSSEFRAYAFVDPFDRDLTIVAVPLADVKQTLHRLLLVEGLVILGVLLALAAVAQLVVRLGLRPLDRMERTAGEIAAGELSRRVSPADNRSEVGRLGRALNSMLERLERAFAERQASEDRLRRFLADASHELRTPLASIRGYAELFRMGATGGEGSVGTRQAMRRIEEESARMGVLVEDLLLLARLDEEPELVLGPIDFAQITRDAVDDAHAMGGPERRITLTAPSELLMQGDGARLRQVLANLVRNALVHTPPEAAIELALHEPADGEVRLSVRDHGPGLPQDVDPAHLFERFWRAEAGRERGRAGAGLGLSIVQAIVSAHGGAITAADADGGGALFTLTLPLV